MSTIINVRIVNTPDHAAHYMMCLLEVRNVSSYDKQGKLVTISAERDGKSYTINVGPDVQQPYIQMTVQRKYDYVFEYNLENGPMCSKVDMQTFLANVLEVNSKHIWLLDTYPDYYAKVIQANSDMNWAWEALSSLPYTTLEFIQANISKPWSWCELSRNHNITWEFVCANPDKPWSWPGLSCNPNITWEIVCNNPEKVWCWYGLSKNPSITWEIICDNPSYPWQWGSISVNPNVTWEIVCNNPDKPWNWDRLSLNPNITLEMAMIKSDKKWNWYSLINKYNTDINSKKRQITKINCSDCELHVVGLAEMTCIGGKTSFTASNIRVIAGETNVALQNAKVSIGDKSVNIN